MTLDHYLLSSQLDHLEKTVRGLHKQRIRRGAKVQAQADATAYKIDQLQSEVEHLRLIVASMLHLLQKNETLHETELDEVFAVLDQMDGQADGKLSMDVHLDGTPRPPSDDDGPPSAMESLVDAIDD